MVEVRKMYESEAAEVRRLGKKTFEWFESLFVPTPKECFVAVEDSNIIGAVIYKYLTISGTKMGYVDFIFVDKQGHGKGIGSRLVDACLKVMEKEGCHSYSALIRDDNVGSWKMFINRGMQRVGLDTLIKEFGFLGMLKLTFSIPMNVATGMELYLKKEMGTLSNKKEKSSKEILNYLIITLLILLPNFIHGIHYGLYVISTMIIVLSIRMLAGYIGTRLSNEKWSFRVCDGGYFIPMIASIFGGIYLIAGNWYPKTYMREKDFKGALAKSSLFQWGSLVLMILLLKTPLADIEIIRSITQLSKMVLILSIVPFYPLSSFGGKRLLEWNRVLYIIIALISIALQTL